MVRYKNQNISIHFLVQNMYKATENTKYDRTSRKGVHSWMKDPTILINLCASFEEYWQRSITKLVELVLLLLDHGVGKVPVAILERQSLSAAVEEYYPINL